MEPASSENNANISSIEKKIASLESEISSIKKLLESWSVEDLKKRLEDVEDVVMVENALTIELKKMMEYVKDQTEKLSKLKSEFSGEMQFTEDKAKLILEELNLLKNRIINLESKPISEYKNELDKFKLQIDDKLSELNKLLIKANTEKIGIENSLARMKAEVEKLNASLQDRKSFLTEILKNKLSSPKTQETLPDSRMLSLEKEVSDIKAILNQLSGKYDESKLEELAKKTILLEKKIENIERILKNFSTPMPIIIE